MLGFGCASLHTILRDEKLENKQPRKEPGMTSKSEKELILAPGSNEAVASEEEELLPALDDMTPREIVLELDKYIVGQAAAKRAVAVALRNRVRRQNLPPE